MTDKEKELLNIIRSHDDPEQAVKIALDLMLTFLETHEAPQDTYSAHPPVSA